jgi:hypothetical protein
MRTFLVNKEFGVSFSSTTFCLHDGDFIWTDSKNGIEYILRAESTIIEFNGLRNKYNFNIPINLNSGGFCYKSYKMIPIRDLIRLFYITDITTQYERDKILDTLV